MKLHTGKSNLDKVWITIGFILSLLWLAESFDVLNTGFNWLAIIVFWFLLAGMVGLVSNY